MSTHAESFEELRLRIQEETNYKNLRKHRDSCNKVRSKRKSKHKKK